MEKVYQDIAAFIDSHREEMLEKLFELVNLEGHFEEKENVEVARAWLQKELEAEGFECRVREVAENRAGILIGVLGKDRPGKPVMFSGHVDT
ncbi:MAG: M20 family peptidase, partial [Clostridiales bacterium]|nr:M20 family peptidase [Clostridiales bacterium]